MPRRIYTYPAGHGLGRAEPDHLDRLVRCSRSACCSLWSTSCAAERAGAPAGANPWDAPTLEWSMPSPPPPYNFAVIPIVASRHPLWEDRTGREARTVGAGHGYAADQRPRNDRDDDRSTRKPDAILRMPGDSAGCRWCSAWRCWRCLLALLLHAWWIGAAAPLSAVLTTGAWLAPRPAPAVAEERVHG